jgi:hypothetical protein
MIIYQLCSQEVERLHVITMPKLALGHNQWLLCAVALTYEAEYILPSSDKIKLYLHSTVCLPYYPLHLQCLAVFRQCQGNFLPPCWATCNGFCRGRQLLAVKYWKYLCFVFCFFTVWWRQGKASHWPGSNLMSEWDFQWFTKSKF